MEHLLKDIRHGLRTLWKHRGMSALAILAIAVGIGTVTTQFSVVHGALFRGLPVPDGDRLQFVEWAVPEGQRLSDEIAKQDLVELAREQTSFDDLIGYYVGTVNFRAGDAPIRLNGTFISAAWADSLRVRPILGRTFEKGEDQPGAEPVMMISHALWQREFGGNPGVINRTVLANGKPTRIVGVMPKHFGFPQNQEVWMPLSHEDATLPRGTRTVMSLDVFGRLHDGVSPQTAAAELSSIAARLSTEYPDTNKYYTTVKVKPLVEEFVGDDVTGMLWTMLFAAFLVLGVACANVANLLLAQASRRTKELAVRSALGATRARLIVQMLTEGLVLSFVGAAAGMLFADMGIDLIWSAVEKLQPPFWMRFTLNPTVLGFVVLVTLGTTFMSGFVPAWQASRLDANTTLKDDSRTSSSLHLGRFARFLVVAQIALSCGLLAVALLLAKVSYERRQIDLPYDPASVFSARMGLFDTDYPDDEARLVFYRNLQTALATDPQLQSIAYSSNYRFYGSGHTEIQIEGQEVHDETEYPRVREEYIGGDYFECLDTGVVAGRRFLATDYEASAPRVAIVNTLFAKRFFPKGDAVGHRFTESKSEEPKWITIVGVVPDLRMQGADSTPGEGVGFYMPYADQPPKFMTVIMRTRGGDPAALGTVLRKHLAALDPNLPIYDAVTLDHHLDRQFQGMDIFAKIFGGLGLSALFLASIGVYGVIAFSVNQRRQEIGIRMALGARGRDIMGMILKQGGIQIGTGLIFGLGIAFGLGKLIATFLEDIPASDPWLFVAVAALLCLVGLLAVLAPARRAAAVSPMQALRVD